MTDTRMFTEIYRPYHLDEMVGQPRAVGIVGGWLRQNRIPRAVAITGEFSCGKTTTARIIARATLCHEPQAGKACGKCKSCVAFDKGTHPDFIEMNSAKDRGIDAMRDLSSKMKMLPLMGKRKIILLDEAHKITDAGWHAMLKDTEEPPAHVIIMIATAVPGAIDPMVMSRFSPLVLQAVSVEECTALLVRIAKDVKLSEHGLTKDHLTRISRVTHAHPRKALALLDQVYTMVLDAKESGQSSVDNALVNGFINQVSSAGVESVAAAIVRSILDGKPASAIARAIDNRSESDALLLFILRLMEQAFLYTTSPKLMDAYYKEALDGLTIFESPEAREPVLRAFECFKDLRNETGNHMVPVADVMTAYIGRAALTIQTFKKSQKTVEGAQPQAIKEPAATPKPAKADDVVHTESKKPETSSEAPKTKPTNGAAPMAKFPSKGEAARSL